MRWGLCVLTAALCAACYDPKVPVGLKCASSGTSCPSGQMCGADQLCHSAIASDASVTTDGTSPIDGPAAIDADMTIIDAAIDAGPPYKAGSVLIAELQTPAGTVAVVSPSWLPTVEQAVGLKAGTAGTLIGCEGHSYDQNDPLRHYRPASGNAGAVMVTGHVAMGAACGADGGPSSGCPPSPIVCNRDGMGVYSCVGLGLPVNEFLPDTGGSMLHVVGSGGADIDAFDTTVPSGGLTRVDMGTLATIANMQRWDGSQALNVTFASMDSGATGSVVRIEMSDGTITTFPFAEPAASRRYAVLLCSFLGAGAVTVTAADIGATFQDILPFATGVRVTIAKGRVLILPQAANGVSTTILSGQGNIVFDAMPRSP